MHSPVFYFFEWQESLIGHPPQPQLQEDLPFFLSLTILKTTVPIQATTTSNIIIDARFDAIQPSIV